MANIGTNSSYSSHKSMSDAKQRRSVSLLNLDSSRKSTNESLFDNLMKDPDKRALILKMLSQENDNIKRYKDKLQKEEVAKHRQIKKTQKLLHFESPTALQRRRALTRVDVDSDSCSSSISSTVTKMTNESSVPFESLLEGVFVYVEIQSEGKDRSAGAKAIMQAMGATVLNSLTKNATHVLFKDGSFNTYQRARLMKVHLVSVLWLEATRNSRVRVPEKLYPALGTESYDANITRICQEYEEAVREEYNRSQATPSLKHRRKTALPTDLRSSQTAFFDLNSVCSRREEISSRLSETFVPSSQACEAEEPVGEEYNDSQAIPSLKHRRRTALPSDLRSQTAIFDLNNISCLREDRSNRLSEKLVPSSQAWEAESIISHTSSKLGYSNEQEKDNMLLDSPQLTSDDSDCGVVNGESMSQERNMLYNLDLTIDDLNSKKTNLANPVETSHCLADLRSSRVSVDMESTSSIPSTTLLSRTLNTLHTSGNNRTVNNAKRKSDKSSSTNLKITTEKNIRTTLGVLSHPSNEENLVGYEKLSNSSDMEITLNNSARKRASEHYNRKNGKKSKSLGNISNFKENKIVRKKTKESFANENINLLRASTSKVNNTSTTSKENLLNESINLLRACTSKVNDISRTSKGNSRNESITSLRASTSKVDNTSTTSKKNLRLSKVVDTSSSEVFNSISFNKDDLPSKIVDTSSEKVGSNTRRSLMTSLQHSCEEMPSLRISMSSNEANSRLSDIPSLRMSLNSNEKNSQSGNLRKSKEVLIENQNAANRKPEQIQPETDDENEEDSESGNVIILKDVLIKNQIAPNKEQVPETNKSNNDDVIPPCQGKPKVFRKLFNINDPIDASEMETNEVPVNSQASKKNLNICAPPPVHLQSLLFTQTVLDVIKKKNVGTKSRIPKKQTTKKQQPSSEFKTSTANKTNIGRVHEKKSKVINKEVTVKKAVRRSERLESHNIESDSLKDEILITPQLSRRSTLEFVEGTTPMRTQNVFTQTKKNVISSIVCTRMHKPEVHTFMQIVKNLKGFTIEDEVSAKTSHLVVGDCKRTVNLLRAITRGCWIVSKEWLFRSLEANKWLKEEDYELTSFSPAVQICRKQRQAFGSLYCMDVFANCGPIYVSRNSAPRCSDLEELIKLCKGTLADCARNASVVVGIWVRYEQVICVNELWLLDCITFNKQKSFKRYLLER